MKNIKQKLRSSTRLKSKFKNTNQDPIHIMEDEDFVNPPGKQMFFVLIAYSVGTIKADY